MAADGEKGCRIPERQLAEILRLLEAQMPNTGKMLRGHIQALEEELVMALQGHEPLPRDPVEEGIARSQRGKE